MAARRRIVIAGAADLIVSATPADVSRLIRLDKPVIRARYEFEELDAPGLWARVEALLVSNDG